MRATHWQGEPVSVWEAVWGVPLVEAWSELGSTNDRARTLARAGTPAWTVVVADHQTSGRGRVGRRWITPAGTALTASIVLRPRSHAHAGLLPLLTGVAVARAIDRLEPGGVAVGLKWPNDVWLAGGKLAGILCEAVGEAVVVGVGLNLRPAPDAEPDPDRNGASDLESATGRPWRAGALLGALIAELRRCCAVPRVRFEGAVAREWADRDILRGRRVRIGAVEGVALGPGADGALKVRRPDGAVTAVRAGHVEWSPDEPPPSTNGS
ncbi:biotin--[acetyl-CoA-carboxylase] ligase [Gemmatimonadota bacterium DH-20]|uniref:Biotin--[acetyl-CoA-carboxylase] ligase n=1 Tax=Gaopeijia maritima TaxID=3119007 RepID=A0ABU9E6Z4_9BACT